MVRFDEHGNDRDEVYSTAGRGATFADVLARRLSRRGLVRGAAAASALAVTGPRLLPVGALAQDGTPAAGPAGSEATVGGLDFEPITLDTGDEPVVAPGHRVRPLLKWGDPMRPGLAAFDPENQSAEEQQNRFGYNCDWIGFFPLPQGSDSSDHGLLVVNNEYTIPALMFPNYTTPNPEFEPARSENAAVEVPEFLTNPTQQTTDIQLAAHGLSIVEVRRDAAGEWETVLDSRYNRRITGTTPIALSGPVAGADALRTEDDPDGVRVTGTLGNCAGGFTPWGTILTGEENFQNYFANLSALPEDDPTRFNHERFGVPEEGSDLRWEEFYPRFDVSQQPTEPFRFGWGVEIDPYDPDSTPKKRTSMGRNKHEGLTSFVAPGGRVAIYTGDDERFEYAYKFVTAGRFESGDRAANLDLLDEGTLYVARFDEDGSGEWLPLVYGEGMLTEAYGFGSQADVLINTRFAADLLGATKMDRPEDFETNPVTGKVYLVCTNNSNRTLDGTDRANPRPQNLTGHIIEITEGSNDHAGTIFAWEMFILAGDPANGATYFAGFEQDMVSPFAAPDNITFDNQGNLWISTDGLPNSLEGNDGLFAVPTEGEERGYVRQFFSAVPESEVSGPVFTPDNTSLFASIQHPGEDGTYQDPTTRWPDGGTMPPRPSVVVIQPTDSSARVGSARG